MLFLCCVVLPGHIYKQIAQLLREVPFKKRCVVAAAALVALLLDSARSFANERGKCEYVCEC